MANWGMLEAAGLLREWAVLSRRRRGPRVPADVALDSAAELLETRGAGPEAVIDDEPTVPDGVIYLEADDMEITVVQRRPVWLG